MVHSEEALVAACIEMHNRIILTLAWFSLPVPPFPSPSSFPCMYWMYCNQQHYHFLLLSLHPGSSDGQPRPAPSCWPYLSARQDSFRLLVGKLFAPAMSNNMQQHLRRLSLSLLQAQLLCLLRNGLQGHYTTRVLSPARRTGDLGEACMLSSTDSGSIGA